MLCPADRADARPVGSTGAARAHSEEKAWAEAHQAQ